MSLSIYEGEPLAYYYKDGERRVVRVREDRSGPKEIFVDEGGVFLCPSDDSRERDTLYISGPTGSGKTRFACQFIKDFMEENEESDGIILTPKRSDATVECNMDMEEIDFVNVEEQDEDGEYKVMNGGLDLENLRDSITFFDDILGIANKKLKEYMVDLNERAIKVGREMQISTITTSHLIRNWKATRLLIQDSKYVVVFPGSGPKYPIETYLKDIIGVEKNKIKAIAKLDTAWLVIRQKAPQAIVHQRGVMIL